MEHDDGSRRGHTRPTPMTLEHVLPGSEARLEPRLGEEEATPAGPLHPVRVIHWGLKT